MADLVKKLKSQIGDDVCEIYSHEALFSEAAAEITRLRAALADAQARSYTLAVAIMGGEDAPGLADATDAESLADQLGKERAARDGWTDACVKAATADAQAVGFAAGVEAAAKRCDAIAGNTADFNQYHRRAAGQCGTAIRAIAGATEMTDSTNAKLRELRERVAGMPCYDSDGDPAGPFDFQIFVRRENVLRLIDAMIQEAGE